LKRAEKEFEEKERVFLAQRNDLRMAEQQERRAVLLVREQDQKIGRETTHLETCRTEEREANRLEVTLENDVAFYEMLLEIADWTVIIAEIALSLAILAAAATLGAAAVGIIIAQGVLKLAQKGLDLARKDVKKKKDELIEQREKHKLAREKREKSESDLASYRFTLETRRGELAARQRALVTVKTDFEEKKNQMKAAVTKCDDLQDERTLALQSKE